MKNLYFPLSTDALAFFFPVKIEQYSSRVTVSPGVSDLGLTSIIKLQSNL